MSKKLGKQPPFYCSPLEKFNFYVNKTAGCWYWNAYIDPDGYSSISIENKSRRASRVSYELFRGPIPKGMHIDHLCRNRECVNPDHLEAVTPKENLHRGLKGRMHVPVTQCKRGHPYAEHAIVNPKTGKKVCKICMNDARRPRRRKIPSQT
jgi:hypothetical protein